MNTPRKETQALGRLLVKNFSSAGRQSDGVDHSAPKGKRFKETADYYQRELNKRAYKPPGFLAGLIVGFALRFITEFIKLLRSGG